MKKAEKVTNGKILDLNFNLVGCWLETPVGNHSALE